MKRKVILTVIICLGIMLITNIANSVEILNDTLKRERYQQRNISILFGAEAENDEIPSEWFNLDLNETNGLSLEIENSVNNPIKGDINRDGYITSEDARKVLKYASGKTEGIDNTANRLDINGDGKVTAIDARKILQLNKFIYTQDMNNSLISNSLVSNFGESIYTCNRLSISETLVIIPNKANDNMELEVESSNSKIASVEFIGATDKIRVTPESIGLVRIRVRDKNNTNIASYITLFITEDIMIKAEDNTRINPQKGDINKDGIITKYDAIKVLKYASGKTEGIDNTANRLDINGDGKTTATDARKILQLNTYIENPAIENLGNLTEYFGEGIENEYNKIYVGDILNLECINKEGQKIETGMNWTSTDTSVVNVENGVITAVGEGKSTITVVTEDYYSSSTTIIVKKITEDSSEIIIKAEDNTRINLQKGDINKDGIITEYDAKEILKYASGKTEGIDNTDNRLDINGDGKINAVDSRRILQLITCIENPTTEYLENLTKIFGEGIENKYNKLSVGDVLNLECINENGEKIETGVEWTSTDTNVIAVENGVITAVGKGRVTVTAIINKDNNKYSNSVSFVVGDITLSNIEIKTNPNKTNYMVGEDLDTTGLTILVKNDNGATNEITTGFTCTPTMLNAEGEQEITVTYKDKTATFSVTVIPILLEKTEIILPPTKTGYVEGQSFEKEGLSLIKIYNNKSESEINEYTITNGENLTVGQESVTISYTEGEITKTAEQPITVEAKSLTGIEVKTMPNKVNYFEGETLNTEGLILTATYNNGTTEEIIEGFTYTPTTLNTVGEQEITVIYEGKTVTFNVNVEKVKLSQISITQVPKKTTYIEGESFDSAGMIVTAKYNNGVAEAVTNYTITNGENLTVGQESVTISYTEGEITKTVEQTITVIAKEEPESLLKGDANGDGKVDFIDILAINKHRLGKAELAGDNLDAADVTGDGKVDFMDILQINKYRLGKIDSL